MNKQIGYKILESRERWYLEKEVNEYLSKTDENWHVENNIVVRPNNYNVYSTEIYYYQAIVRYEDK